MSKKKRRHAAPLNHGTSSHGNQKNPQSQEPATRPWYQLDAVILSFGILLVFLIYANSLDGPFLFDDENNIKDNAHIRLTSLSPADILKAGLESPHPRRFVAYASFALNYYFHQYDTTGYRVVNLVIHVATGIILYFLVWTTLSTPTLRSKYSRAREIALVTALIWLLHPVATQSVSYIVQRMNSMSAMFYALSLLLYARARLASGNKTRWLLLASCALSGMLSLGSKEIAATLPIFIVLYEWYFFQDLDWSWVKQHYRRVLALTGLTLLVGLFILGSNPLQFILGVYEKRHFTPLERLLTESRVVISYISLLVFPHPSRLCLENDFRISHSLFDPITTLFSIGGIVGMVWVAVRTARHARLLSFTIFWFIGNLVIESSIIGLEIFFEHRTYLPSMFPVLLAVTLIYRHLKHDRVRLGILCMVMILFSIWTHDRNRVWGNPVAMYKDVIQKYPRIPRAYNNLGTYLSRQNQVEKAIPYLYEAVRLRPDYADAHQNLGKALVHLGKLDEGIPHFRKAFRLKPNGSIMLSNLGGALLRQGKNKEATVVLQEALQLDPGIAQTHYNLGVALSNLGRDEEAIRSYRQAIQLQPDYVDAYDNLGVALFQKNRFDEAFQAFTKGVQIAPDHANVQAHLGIALLQRGRAAEAVSHLGEALRIQPGHADAVKYHEHARRKAALAAENSDH
jgi:Flp pilus assembly protein TadD